MELEEGKYYWINWLDNNSWYIFKHEKHENQNAKAIRDGSSYDRYYTFSQNSFAKKYYRNMREATPLERRWLDLCVAQNQFVPKPKEEIELLNRIEIY